MTHADLSAIRHTSVTLRATTGGALKAAANLMGLKGVPFSEQRLMRECLRLALKLWRGKKAMAARNRKYNKRLGEYQIVPFYTSEALRSVAWVRCHHAGMSLSRLMDFAVCNYLQRVVEYWLRFEYRGRDKADAALWQDKYSHRRHSADFIISYKAHTEKNDGSTLEYTEKSEILPWPPPLTVPSLIDDVSKLP